MEKSSARLSPKIWLGMLTIYLVWGSTYLAIRFAVQTIPPFLMAASRFLIAGSILYTWRRLSGDAAPTRREWRSAGVIGILLLVGGNGGVSWAEQRVASGIAALLVGAVPLWMVVLELLPVWGSHRQARPGKATLLGIVIGFFGIALLISPADLTGMHGDVDLIGALALTLAAFFWSLGSLYGRGAVLPASPLLSTGMEMLVGGFGLLLLGSLTGEWRQFDMASISTASLLGVAYLVLIGALLGFATYTWLLRVAPLTLVSTYAYVNPMIAIFIGALLAQEPLTPRILLAASIIIGAVVIITRSQRPARKVALRADPTPTSGND